MLSPQAQAVVDVPLTPVVVDDIPMSVASYDAVQDALTVAVDSPYGEIDETFDAMCANSACRAGIVFG